MKLLLPAILSLFLASCSTYESSVASRSVSAAGSPDGGKVVYSVTYK